MRLRYRLPFVTCLSLLIAAEAWCEVGEPGTTADLRMTAQRSQPSLSPELAQLKAQVDKARKIYRTRMVNTRDQAGWSIMHTVIAYGTETQIRLDGPAGQPVNAIGWLCYNYPGRGMRLFYLRDGNIHWRIGPGYQGHNGQFLSMLAQSRVNINYPMKIDGHELAVRDLVHREMETCQARSELTFKLIGIAHYIDSDTDWKNEDGEAWSIERMVQDEISQTIHGAACGGTHRLTALAYAVQKRRQQKKPITGHFQRAEKYLHDYHQHALRLQNYDGSFSTDWLKGRAASPDIERRVLTSGHILEWLSFSLPDDELHRPEMIKAVRYLSGVLIAQRHRKIPVGPLGHGLHALAIYEQRALQTTTRPDEVASRRKASAY